MDGNWNCELELKNKIVFGVEIDRDYADSRQQVIK